MGEGLQVPRVLSILRGVDLKPSSPQITDSALRLPGEFPDIPDDVRERFPSMGTWMDAVNHFFSANSNALNDFARAVLDVTEIAGVLTVDPNSASIYIRRSRGDGAWSDPDTAYYVNRDGYFSLLNLLLFNPVERTLTVTGTIIADAGVIGGWIISPTTLSKNNAVLDSAGQLALGTGNDIIIISATDPTYRVWAGNATAGTATFSVSKTGALFSTAGTIGGFTIGTDYLRDTANSMGLASTVTGGDDVRFWAGATFANRATAPFRVTEAGALTAINGTFSNSAAAGDYVLIDGAGLTVGSNSAAGTIHMANNAGNPFLNFRYNGNVRGSWAIQNDYSAMQLSEGGAGSITIDPRTGVVLTGAIGFNGDGSSISQLNAGNIASGTVPTARLGSGTANSGTWLRGDQSWNAITAGDVSGLAASATTDTTNASNISSGTLPNARISLSATGTGDVPINGFVSLGGVKLATVA